MLWQTLPRKGVISVSGKKALHMITFLLLVIGGLNWLLVGLFSWDVGMLFGGMSAVISRVIYVLVGLSAVYVLATHKGDCKMCSTGSMKSM
jgi:uncharacterized membrane protein YuzA (DUF378 family)